MMLSEYVRSKGSGEISRIVRVAEVANTTVHRALKGQPVSRYETAKRISDATGGVVSIAELCEPATPKQPAPRRRTSPAAKVA